MKSCIFTGSFDPFTIGHLDIVKRSAAIFDKVYVAVLDNEDKKTMFSMGQRVEITKAAVCNVKNAEVLSSNGLTVDLCNMLGVNTIIRGIRSESDVPYEREMAFVNSSLKEGIETVFLLSKYPHISSTGARQIIELFGNLNSVLTDEQIKVINNITGRK